LCSESKGGVGQRWAPLGCAAWRPNLPEATDARGRSCGQWPPAGAGSRGSEGEMKGLPRDGYYFRVCKGSTAMLHDSIASLGTAAVVNRYTVHLHGYKQQHLCLGGRKSGTGPGGPVVQANRTQSVFSRPRRLGFTDSLSNSQSINQSINRPPIHSPTSDHLLLVVLSPPLTGPCPLRALAYSTRAARLIGQDPPTAFSLLERPPSLSPSRLPPLLSLESCPSALSRLTTGHFASSTNFPPPPSAPAPGLTWCA
jgi:hypothetical protein